MIPTYTPAIVYIDLNGLKEPKFNFWYPYELPEDVRKLVGIKTSSIISDDPSFIPEVLLVFPLPSLKLKMLIKYFERLMDENGEKILKSALIFLFSEEDDVIFYRYMSYIDSYFGETIKKIIEFENIEGDRQVIFNEIVQLKNTLIESTEYLRSKSQFLTTPKETEKGYERSTISNQIDYKFKVVILGDPSVGKTSTILRFTDNVFLRAYIPTMGLIITQKRFKIDKNYVDLRLWDVGGQTHFETVRRQFYEGASAFIILFDLANPRSFSNVPKWHEDIIKYLGSRNSISGYLIGNKIDLTHERIVSVIDGIRLAKALDIDYLEISALTGDNVEFTFTKISKLLLL